MIPSLEAYYRPETLSEALRLLRDLPSIHILAGGTDLLLEDEGLPAVLDISRCDLSGISADDDLCLGATCDIEQLFRNPIAQDWGHGILPGACINFATLQVRNMATIGGNIAHALPAADLVPALMALDAKVKLVHLDSGDRLQTREIELDGFATAPFQTQATRTEILTQVRIPAGTRHWVGQFRKIGRVLKDLAQVNCAVSLCRSGSVIQEARVVVGAVHPTVLRVQAAEQQLCGQDVLADTYPAAVSRAVEAIRDEIKPISDQRASREWRRHVAGVLVRRSLEYLAQDPSHIQAPSFVDGPLYRLGVHNVEETK